ncbi:MAG: site-specific integrase [Planctomycetota bacterium]
MARRSGSRGRSAPKYRLHKKTNQAVVTVNGSDFYLGKYDSPKSHQRYKQVIADHWNPPGANLKPTVPKANDGPTTITNLAVEFAKKTIAKHSKESNEWKYQVKPVLKEIRETYGHLSASEFGPIRFENFRQTLVSRGLCRQVVRRKSTYVVQMFRLGVKLELIKPELLQRLLAVGPVEMTQQLKKKRWSVDLDLVKATQAELTPVLADMVEVQRLIGARPTELCKMRPVDIDRTGEIWIYSPTSHKTQHHGHSRRISIGPKAQAVLKRYLLRDPQAFCFTPSEAFNQHLERRKESRVTPHNEGNRPKQRKQTTFKPCYDQNSYRRAIERACLRANPIPEDIKDDDAKVKEWKSKYVWKPNQLRKSAATEARKTMDLETAQLVLGHASKRTTERFYAELDNERAIEFARKHG